MSNSQPDSRLDRIEALVESIAKTAQANTEALAETRLLVNSVAKTAQSNSEAIAQLKNERVAKLLRI